MGGHSELKTFFLETIMTLCVLITADIGTLYTVSYGKRIEKIEYNYYFPWCCLDEEAGKCLSSTTRYLSFVSYHLTTHIHFIEEKMSEIVGIIMVIEIAILLINIVLTWIYILPIIFVRRFHTVTNMLTCNFCLASFICCTHWAVFHILCYFYPTILNGSVSSCTFIPYFQTMVNCLVIYSLAMITVNRFFIVIYPSKGLFKKYTWFFISSTVQWILAIVLPLPYFTLSFKVNIFVMYTKIDDF
jgi:hypothetical protein